MNDYHHVNDYEQYDLYFIYYLILSNKWGNICKNTSPIKVPNENAINFIIIESFIKLLFFPKIFYINIKTKNVGILGNETITTLVNVNLTLSYVQF